MSAYDHKRCTPEGRRLGELLVRLADKQIPKLALEGLADTRCASCAFRAGTVPNGCPQTGLDAFKALADGVPFQCHAVVPGTGKRVCFGYFAAMLEIESRGGLPPEMKAVTDKYEFSPPDQT